MGWGALLPDSTVTIKTAVSSVGFTEKTTNELFSISFFFISLFRTLPHPSGVHSKWHRSFINVFNHFSITGCLFPLCLTDRCSDIKAIHLLEGKLKYLKARVYNRGRVRHLLLKSDHSSRQIFGVFPVLVHYNIYMKIRRQPRSTQRMQNQ